MYFRPLRAGKALAVDVASPDMDGEMAEDSAVRERVLKFEVQMYRLREGEYVVDFQVGLLNLATRGTASSSHNREMCLELCVCGRHAD